MLTLLMSLAVDASTKLFFDIVEGIIMDAALSDTKVWQLLEREFPAVCRMIEAEMMARPEGNTVRQEPNREP